MTVYCCSVSLCNCESALPTLSLNLSTPLCIRWELGLLGARWLLPEVMVFSRYFKLECSLPMQGWLKLKKTQRQTIMPRNCTPTPNQMSNMKQLCLKTIRPLLIMSWSAILQCYSASGVVLNNRITKLPLTPCFLL